MLFRTPSQISGPSEFPLPEGQPGGDSAPASVGGGGSSSSAGSTTSSNDGSSAPSGTSSSPASNSVPSSESSPALSQPASPQVGSDDGTPTDVFDFSSLLNGQFENGEVTVPLPPAAPVVPIAPVVPGAPPTVATPTGQAPVAPAAAEVQPAATPGPQPPLSLAEPGRLAEAMASQEAAIVDEAARTMFALSPEEITGLEENAVAIIPKLLARTYVQAQRSMLMTLQKALPAMLGTHLTQRQKHETNEGKFYDRWKDSGIDRAQHGPLVSRLASMYRKMNPGATFDQMVEELGPAVVMSAKITPPAPSVAAGARPINGLVRPQAQPFVPAGGGPGAMSNQVQGESWDILDPNKME